MPLFEENNQKNNTNQTDGLDTQTKPDPQQKPSSLLTTIGSLLPFAPLVFEQFTGQKVPQLSGTMAEIQLALSNIQLAQTQIINNQNQLALRITNLETSASQSFTNLQQQFQSLRLTHTREKKEIEYNPRPELNTEDQNY
jgi:hypothetical protein